MSCLHNNSDSADGKTFDFSLLDKALFDFSIKVQGKVSTKAFSASPNSTDTFEVRQIAWVDDDIGKAILIKHQEDESTPESGWDFLIIAWPLPISSSEAMFYEDYLLRDVSIKRIEKDIAALLNISEEKLRAASIHRWKRD